MTLATTATNIAQKRQKPSVSSNATKLLDRMFLRLKSLFPAWKQAFENLEDYNNAKQVWFEELLKADVMTPEQLKQGLDCAAKSTSPFFPSVGQFIAWCQEGVLQAQGIPTLDELLKRINQYASFHGFDHQHEFQFQSDVEYDLVFGLYCQNQQRQWTVDELRKEANKALKATAEKIAQGTYRPRPRQALPAKVSFIAPEQQQKINQSGVAYCKAVLRGQA